MTDDAVLPISVPPAPVTHASGRPADLIAAAVAGFGTTLCVITAIWFFLGFAENDTRPEHLTSAFVLTSVLFAFAIGPFLCTTYFAWLAHKSGAKRVHLIWTLCLMLPWVGLGFVAMTHTPLPLWSGGVMASLASLLSLWALVSFILDIRSSAQDNTVVSHENEVPKTEN